MATRTRSGRSTSVPTAAANTAPTAAATSTRTATRAKRNVSASPVVARKTRSSGKAAPQQSTVAAVAAAPKSKGKKAAVTIAATTPPSASATPTPAARVKSKKATAAPRSPSPAPAPRRNGKGRAASRSPTPVSDDDASGQTTPASDDGVSRKKKRSVKSDTLNKLLAKAKSMVQGMSPEEMREVSRKWRDVWRKPRADSGDEAEQGDYAEDELNRSQDDSEVVYGGTKQLDDSEMLLSRGRHRSHSDSSLAVLEQLFLANKQSQSTTNKASFRPYPFDPKTLSFEIWKKKFHSSILGQNIKVGKALGKIIDHEAVDDEMNALLYVVIEESLAGKAKEMAIDSMATTAVELYHLLEKAYSEKPEIQLERWKERFKLITFTDENHGVVFRTRINTAVTNLSILDKGYQEREMILKIIRKLPTERMPSSITCLWERACASVDELLDEIEDFIRHEERRAEDGVVKRKFDGKKEKSSVNAITHYPEDQTKLDFNTNPHRRGGRAGRGGRGGQRGGAQRQQHDNKSHGGSNNAGQGNRGGRNRRGRRGRGRGRGSGRGGVSAGSGAGNAPTSKPEVLTSFAPTGKQMGKHDAVVKELIVAPNHSCFGIDHNIGPNAILVDSGSTLHHASDITSFYKLRLFTEQERFNANSAGADQKCQVMGVGEWRLRVKGDDGSDKILHVSPIFYTPQLRHGFFSSDELKSGGMASGHLNDGFVDVGNSHLVVCDTKIPVVSSSKQRWLQVIEYDNSQNPYRHQHQWDESSDDKAIVAAFRHDGKAAYPDLISDIEADTELKRIGAIPADTAIHNIADLDVGDNDGDANASAEHGGVDRNVGNEPAAAAAAAAPIGSSAATATVTGAQATNVQQVITAIQNIPASLALQHVRHGHANLVDVRASLHNAGITNCTMETLGKCRICSLCKIRKANAHGRSDKRASKVGAVVHVDLQGPLLPGTRAENQSEVYRYFLLAVDDYSRWVVAAPMKDKTEATMISAFKQIEDGYRPFGELSAGTVIFADSGSENVHALTRYAHEKGYLMNVAPSRSQSSNGRAEACARAIKLRMRILNQTSDIPARLWVSTLEHSVYLTNLLPTAALGKRSPFSVVFGEHPKVDRLRQFGAYTVVKSAHDADFFKANGREGVLIGMDVKTHSYKVMMLDTGKVVNARDVIVHEDPQRRRSTPPIMDQFYDEEVDDDDDVRDPDYVPPGAEVKRTEPVKQVKRSEPAAAIAAEIPVSTSVSVPTVNINSTPAVVTQPTTSATSAVASATSVCADDQSPCVSGETTRSVEGKTATQPAQQQQQQVTPQSDTTAVSQAELQEQQLGSSVEEQGLRRSARIGDHKLAEIAGLDFQFQAELCACEHLDKLHVSTTDLADPDSPQDALSRPDGEEWKQSMLAEIANMAKFGVFEYVRRRNIDPKAKLVPLRWVFQTKRGVDGRSIVKRKSRLVAAAVPYFYQAPNAYSPTLSVDSMRVILAVAAAHKLVGFQFDISAAFLQGDEMDVDVYLRPPAMYQQTDADGNDLVLRAVRPIYGFSDSSLRFFKKMTKVLKEIGFTAFHQETCVFYHQRTGTIIGLYVDDGIVFWT